MEPPFGPYVCPITVGRAREIAVIEDRLARGGSVLLVSGEAGIGKSRLVREARAIADRYGRLILQGNCFEPDQALPYAPILDLLRALLDRRPAAEIARLAGPPAATVARLLPELAAALPDAQPLPELGEEGERRLFRALVDLISRLSDETPLLVVLEDLHWSDDGSLEIALHLARRVRSRPVALVLTYRTDDVQPALAHLLAELDRERLATELTLGRLPAADVETMLRAMLGLDRPVPAGLLHLVSGLTEGNPFFVEEVSKALGLADRLAGGASSWDPSALGDLRVPRSVQDAVERRWRRVSETARRVLALAAVTGRRFDFALLQELSGLDEAELLRVIKELIEAQLVVEESADRFAFRHALTRQAISARLLARERRSLHRAVADAIRRRAGDAPEPHLADLASHFWEAEAWPEAFDYGHRAGQQARALFAPRAAIEHFGRALEAARRLGMPSAAALPVYRERGLAHETIGDFDRARADHEATLRIARETGDRRAEWQTLIDLGMLWMGRDYARTGDHFREALALAREFGDPSLLARSLNRLGNWLANQGEPDPGARHHLEALAIAEEAGDHPLIAETFDLLGMAAYIGGDIPKSAAYYERAVALFRELDDRFGLASSLATLAVRGGGVFDDVMVPAATPAEAARSAEEARRIARGIDWRAGEAYALVHLGLCIAAMGDYGGALGQLRTALAIAEEIEHREWLTAANCAMGGVLLEVFALPEARRHLDRAFALAQATASPHWCRIVTGFLASAAVAQGSYQEAEALLQAVAWPAAGTATQPERYHGCARAELALARGDPDLALRVVDDLIARTPHASDQRPIPRLAWLRGAALAALAIADGGQEGRGAEAERTLIALREAEARRGARAIVWSADAALARLYHHQGRREAAARAIAAAQTVIAELAATIADAALEERFVAGAAATLPRVRSRPRPDAAGACGGLTRREREVAIEVGRGKSNREIAAALFVGERTVETHVGHILAKLGLASRAQIAAWAAEHGLVATADRAR